MQHRFNNAGHVNKFAQRFKLKSVYKYRQSTDVVDSCIKLKTFPIFISGYSKVSVHVHGLQCMSLYWKQTKINSQSQSRYGSQIQKLQIPFCSLTAPFSNDLNHDANSPSGYTIYTCNEARTPDKRTRKSLLDEIWASGALTNDETACTSSRNCDVFIVDVRLTRWRFYQSDISSDGQLVAWG